EGAPATTASTGDASAAPATAGDAAAPGTSVPAAGVDRQYSPAVRKLARDHGLDTADLSRVTRTGQGGRVTEQDVLDWVARGEGSVAGEGGAPSAPEAAGEATGAPGATTDDGERVPLTSIRRTIAKRMVESVHD